MARNTRQLILSAALHMIESGEGNFTYEQLASSAGVARQTLYSQFPDRAQLLIAVVDSVREELGADDLIAPVFEAGTAREALSALLDFHVAYTPKILAPARVIEALRAKDPDLSKAFESRSRGRRPAARHVITRLAAEGDLVSDWSVDEATDFLSSLVTASFTSDLIEERNWTTDQLRSRLSDVIERTLLIQQ